MKIQSLDKPHFVLQYSSTFAADVEERSLYRCHKMSADWENGPLSVFFYWTEEREKERERESVKEHKRLSGVKHSQMCLFNNNRKKKNSSWWFFTNSANVSMLSAAGVYINICLSVTPSIPCQVFMTGLIYHSTNTLH